MPENTLHHNNTTVISVFVSD